MVVMPDEFVATRYPGYFWNTDDQKLYSIKVTGTKYTLWEQMNLL